VLVLEQHYKAGGLATWFKRPGRHLFDVSLHGFPAAMMRSCRRYWSDELAQQIVPLRALRFLTPQYDLTTSFDWQHSQEVLRGHFGLSPQAVQGFHEALLQVAKQPPAASPPPPTTQALFEAYFPGRPDVHRFLLEPIAYANGSTLEDPAFTFATVWLNFMAQGAWIFQGGADHIIGQMVALLKAQGVQVRTRSAAQRIVLQPDGAGYRVAAVVVDGQAVQARAVVSNASLSSTLFDLVGPAYLPEPLLQQARAVRLNTSSCQVYLGLKPDYSLTDQGDLVFMSQNPDFSTEELTRLGTRSRAFSFYYPHHRPQVPDARCAVVASMNATWEAWAHLTPDAYQEEKAKLIDATLQDLGQLIPGIREHINWSEAATPKTLHRYTRHPQGVAFGTKYEGLAVSKALPQAIGGLCHAGSVGIIMSGWLGAMNYGVIGANTLAGYLARYPKQATLAQTPAGETPAKPSVPLRALATLGPLGAPGPLAAQAVPGGASARPCAPFPAGLCTGAPSPTPPEPSALVHTGQGGHPP
jgi:phytoene dehydrogenase-like protein